MKIVKVLIVEDHPLIVNAYKQAFEHIAKDKTFLFNIDVALNLDEASTFYNNQSYMAKCNLVFLDVQVPVSSDKSLLSGEDLGLKIREKYPETKVAILTSLSDNYRLRSILKGIDPDALLLKGDLTPGELIRGIQSLLSKPPYYTVTVLEHLRRSMTTEIDIDSTDRKLLYELSLSTKNTELCEILNLSKAGVEKRKRNLKIILEVEGESDRELILEARNRGFI
ncbi:MULTISPECIES: response regulator [unclassified Leeuwenhoekiella]|uniref:response regulator n=1 Tax=unclassified Leeuwenhoekiella TaxID=2615029 RepID=UPI000C39FFBA|nr:MULTISPECIES: response regulator [unclassified Leeuwenhoekiella]MAW94453.1 response regulator [Leeuwenhoekiella sp.]MBA81131.1 response regulator [Leeuwenhoekiella sp.]|tara:strand:+ start:55010 stop:55681 length:672 start_codon:yes stop_codon:yes gene_type:complete